MLIARKGDTTTLGAKGPVKLKNPPAAGRSILRTFPSEPSRRRRVQGQSPVNPRAKGASIKKLFFFLTKTILKFTDMHDIILSES